MNNPRGENLAEGPSEDSPGGGLGTPLCPHCLAEVTERTDFCPKCSAPVGAFSTLDPMKQIYSTGWLFRRASGEGVSVFAVIGMWVILGPPVLLLVITMIFGDRPRTIDLLGLGRVGLGILVAVLYGAILFRVTNSYWRFKLRKPGHCVCGYDLRKLTEPRCPECARPFDFDTIEHLGDPRGEQARDSY